MLQSLIRAIYPPQCVACGGLTEAEFALCGTCWRDSHFIGGLVCDLCGMPLPGEPGEGVVHCDDCLARARPWDRGRAVFLYRDTARRMVLALKHGDRTDLARSAGTWMARAAAEICEEETVLVPVPLHPLRLLTRRYNQAALLAQRMGRVLGLSVVPDALLRRKRTKPLEGHSVEARFAALDGALVPHPRRIRAIAGRPVLLVDDVMTSGATLSVASEALLQAGATRVSVQVLARVCKDA